MYYKDSSEIALESVNICQCLYIHMKRSLILNEAASLSFPTNHKKQKY